MMSKEADHDSPGAQPPDRRIQDALVRWYRRAKRDLPWRRTSDPYAIWLSEVMLQQTRVDTVVPYYERFLGRFPTVARLAAAPVDEVLRTWSGLGYYRRARLLHEGAQAMVAVHAGRFPETAQQLGQIPGIGRYTAGAVASIAFGSPSPVVDGNVARVFARFFAIEEDVKRAAVQNELWRLAARWVDERDPGTWNQALMELGATVCTPRAPRCDECPLRNPCEARRQNRTADLPVVAAAAKPRLWSRFALVARTPRGVLLGQRRPDALFGGLWEPPMVDASPREIETALAGFGRLVGRSVRGEVVGRVTHVLSHRKLDVTVLAGTLGRSLRLRNREEPAEYQGFTLALPETIPELAMSTLARKVLAEAP